MVVLALSGCCRGPVVLADGQNFSFQGSLEAKSQEVPSGEDSPVDWSGLTVDLLGAAMDASEVTELTIVRMDALTQEEVLAKLNCDDLRQSDLSGFVSYAPPAGETAALLSDFSLQGTYVDPPVDVVEGLGTYMLAAISGEQYRMLLFFAPVVGAEPATIAIASDSATLTYDVSLADVEPVPLSDGCSTEVDWSELKQSPANSTCDADLYLPDIDTLMVARYDLSLEELEADFLALDSLAVQRFEADVEGLGSYDLGDLVDEDGEPFESVGDGTWLLALRCSTCLNPTPLFLSVLE